tara:strand:+ start:167 stop:1078 length:912 start_codon:yes stop_codon:yes gene_type:complete
MKLIIKKIIVLICFINMCFPIWLDALLISHKASTLSLSGTGIGGFVDASLNPASLYNIETYMGMSSNKGYIDAKGNKSTWVFGNESVHRFISVESFGVDDIPVHNDNDGIPEGVTSTKWLAFDYGSNIDLNKFFSDTKGFQIGYNMKLNYIKLDSERYWGYTFDFGMNKIINEKINLGLVLKNLGQEYSVNKKINIDDYSYLGLGLAYSANIIKRNKFYIDADIYFDYLYSKQNNIFKFAVDTQFPYVNLMLGTSFINGDHKYKDFSYGLSFKFRDWMVLFGSSVHDNAAIGSPTSFEIRKYF